MLVDSLKNVEKRRTKISVAFVFDKGENITQSAQNVQRESLEVIKHVYLATINKYLLCYPVLDSVII